MSCAVLDGGMYHGDWWDSCLDPNFVPPPTKNTLAPKILAMLPATLAIGLGQSSFALLFCSGPGSYIRALPLCLR